MSGYLVRVWCLDCCGEDFDGCFDGSSTIWGDRDAQQTVLDDEPPFASIAAAEEQATTRIGGAPWDFEVIDAQTRAVVDHSSAAAAKSGSSASEAASGSSSS